MEFYQLYKLWITGSEFEYKGQNVTIKNAGIFFDDKKYHSFKLSNGETLYSEPKCLCCIENIQKERPRICPLCKHEFKGNGWDGIDAHWRANHEDIMPYEIFWKTLCEDHKN